MILQRTALIRIGSNFHFNGDCSVAYACASIHLHLLCATFDIFLLLVVVVREEGMAGLVVASAVLKEVLSTLKSLVLNEFWLLWGVKKEKDKLQSYLETIEAVLQDAERRQVKEMNVKNWLQKIKDAAHDAEDVLDEFRIEAQRRTVENQAAGMRKKVGKLFYPPVFRFKMAHKMQKLRKDFEHIAKERSLFQFTVGVVDSQPRISRARETCSAVVSEVYGRDTEKADLLDLLIKSESENEEDLSVIPIVGMGGLGKTTLAQLVYNDKRVVTHFKLRMWVYVSENFDVGKLLKEILESATQKKADQLSMDILKNRLQEELSGKRYLLVLDDVWNDNPYEWDRLKALLTCGANGSKLLVTTRHDAVAKIMHAVPRPRLGILSNEESWNLFQKLANPPPMCVAIGQEMVEKCTGLPLAIRTLGGLMSSKETVSEWDSVRDSSNLWKPQDNGGGILPILQLSYDHLTPSLKRCFAYCAVIPKGRSFAKQKLIRQWIALGFIHSDEENELLEEKAQGYFNQLIQRSLFQAPDFKHRREEHYKMHDLIHDLVRFVGEKECFIMKASMDIVPKETRHLSVQEDEWAREPKNLGALKKCEKLRSMSIYGCCFGDINACLSLTCLRVLDLCSAHIDYLPNSIDKLKHLRYLDVSYTSITELPETICNLHSLQTLIIGIKVSMLPKNMKRMISLTHIDLGMYYFACCLPKGIGELPSLRTLSGFTVGGESEAGIEQLKGLNQLCGDLGITSLNRVRNGECAREANLKAKKHLHSLVLSWDDGAVVYNYEEVIENLEPHSRLKKLAVESYMGMKFPNWMKMLTNLTDIKLSDCDCCEHLPPLWRLPFLESLELRNMLNVKYIVEFDESDNSEDIFPCLKHLELRNMFKLKGWSSQQEDGDGDEQGRERDERVILQGLRTLDIFECPSLAPIPWLRHVSSLTSLRMSEVGSFFGNMGWDMIPASQSLTELSLYKVGNLIRWSVQEAGEMIFSSLRDLDIIDCPRLYFLPQLLVPALETLKMSGVKCDKIEFSISHSLRLVRLEQMPNLERLSLKASNDNEHVVLCPSIEFYVNECPSMTRLPHLLASSGISSISTSNEMLLKSAVNYTSLSYLCIEDLPEVKHLPQELGPTHTGLRKLTIRRCPKLTSLSNQLENLLALEVLIVEGCYDLVLSLPDGLQQQQQRSPPPLNSLQALQIIYSCENQISLPGDGIVLTSLCYLKIVSCGNLESISADKLQNLTSLEIMGCPKVLSLPDGLQQQQQQSPPLNSLEVLEIINSCENQISLPGDGIVLTSLRSLTIVSCRNLESISADKLQNLASLEIEDCPKVWSSLEHLKSITSLKISRCPDMTTFLGSVENLTSLSRLEIVDCPGKWSFPESVKNLKSLADLTINDCPGISSLPESMGDLTMLYRLNIWGSTIIRTLPNGLKRLKNLFPSMGGLTLLHRLEIWGCTGIRTLPNGLKRFENICYPPW